MSAVYPKFRESLVGWALNGNPPAGLAFYALGVDADYVYDAAHNDLADIPGGAIVMPEHLLDNVTYVNGIINADDELWTGLTLSETLDAVVIYMKDGAAASYLAAYIDESVDGSVPQLITATTGTVRFHSNGIFRV